jgi:NAD(P)-dependent dehydrogenase (short-subunit alcohol dehydrogenase family)
MESPEYSRGVRAGGDPASRRRDKLAASAAVRGSIPSGRLDRIGGRAQRTMVMNRSRLALPPKVSRRIWMQALVTGASRGLGLEMTRQLLVRGDRVAAACRHPGRALALTRLAGEHPGRLHVLPLDLTDPRSIAEVAREIGALDLDIDLLVNNAGVLIEGERFGAIESKSLRESFSVNAEGALLLTQALNAQLADGAKVVNLSSTLGSIARTDSLYSPSYSISKAALNMATRLLSIALAERGIIVVAVSPGWVQTDMGGSGATLKPDVSIASMLRVIDHLKASDNGRFLSQNGETIPW